jgi:feruloyl esterase
MSHGYTPPGRRVVLTLCAGIAISAFGAKQALAAAGCAGLAALHAPNVTITTAATVEDPSAISPSLAHVRLAAPLCRVKGFIAPTRDSHIAFEVWLPPQAAWNHKLEAVGNGGYLGALMYGAMVPGFNLCYATMTTDLGHVNPPREAEYAAWALGHPQKIIDFAYRAEHLATQTAKQLIEAYYRAEPAHSYYAGCSAGGIEGIVELLRYPQDYDGYIIGDATPDHVGQEMEAMWNTLAASLTDPRHALTPAELALVHKAVLRQCVGKDGGATTDTFLTDPPACGFEVSQLECQPGQDPSGCLSPAAVAIFDKIYQGPVDPLTHQSIAPGVTVGSELLWPRYFTGKKNPVPADRPWSGMLADMIYSDPEYLSREKYLSFNFGSDYQAILKKTIAGETVESVFDDRKRDLDAFERAGGKVIQYHGWDDPNIPALSAVEFFNSIVADQARRHHLTAAQARRATLRFYRLFMVPGMGHCGGGAGPSEFGQPGPGPRPPGRVTGQGPLTALDRWVELGIAPRQFVAARLNSSTHKVDMKRPICPYPEEPRWNGSGDSRDASSFTCAVPHSMRHAAN